MTVGQKIKKLRIEKGLTQKDLADQLHVTFQTVSKWEKDENEPDIATLRELAKLFGCSFDYLLSEDDEEAPKEVAEEPVVKEVPVIKETIVIHQNEMHVCARCGKDIPENELVILLKNPCFSFVTTTLSLFAIFFTSSKIITHYLSINNKKTN